MPRTSKYPIIFTRGHALLIKKFIYAHNVNRIIIHCDAGVSRSAGIGAALNKYFNGRDQFYFDNYCPNMHI